MNNLFHNIGLAIIVLGLGFDVAGCIGLFRLKDIFSRLQAASKGVTLGTCWILLGAILIKGPTAAGARSVLAILFLLFVVPAAAFIISRAARVASEDSSS